MIAVSKSKGDFDVDFFGEIGVAHIGKHGPRERFRECSNMSALIQIHFQSTQETIDRRFFVVAHAVFVNLRHRPGRAFEAVHLLMY